MSPSKKYNIIEIRRDNVKDIDFKHLVSDMYQCGKLFIYNHDTRSFVWGNATNEVWGPAIQLESPFKAYLHALCT
jgi:hypothetical protein